MQSATSTNFTKRKNKKRKDKKQNTEKIQMAFRMQNLFAPTTWTSCGPPIFFFFFVVSTLLAWAQLICRQRTKLKLKLSALRLRPEELTIVKDCFRLAISQFFNFTVSHFLCLTAGNLGHLTVITKQRTFREKRVCLEWKNSAQVPTKPAK